jgi:quercetin dioxygenase-like cupin family protein
LRKARENGISQGEMAAVLTHLAFYSGWPKAWAAFRIAKEIWTEGTSANGVPSGGLFPLGKPNDAYAQYFVGQSYLNMLTGNGVSIANVTFEPGCRNNWHIHHADQGGGQVLLCVSGRGWYQEWDKESRELHPGDVVEIPAGVKHWHGATKDSWFSHLAVEVPGKNNYNQWLEPVCVEDYE